MKRMNIVLLICMRFCNKASHNVMWHCMPMQHLVYNKMHSFSVISSPSLSQSNSIINGLISFRIVKVIIIIVNIIACAPSWASSSIVAVGAVVAVAARVVDVRRTMVGVAEVAGCAMLCYSMLD